ncbi:MAG: ATPase [Rouxiella aceris]|uniref:ATPase n=1 Tax=Rouxiella aceris TaxID=2703884 RepID=UPI0028508EEF|nr:ATPase [Rouxiella aceris]MDR3432721.1 ATPase [Rouxiella aceris]
MSDNKIPPAAEGQIAKNESHAVVAYHESGQLYFKPDTEELIIIPDSEAGEFENHWRELLTCVDQFHQAGEYYSSSLEQYGILKSQPDNVIAEIRKQQEVVSIAEEALENKRKKLKNTLGKFETTGLIYKNVVELIPIVDKSKKTKGGKSIGQRFVYVKKSYYDASKNKNKKWHALSLKNKDKKVNSESIYTRDKHGNVKIDTNKLKQQLTHLKLTAVKVQLKDYINLDEFNVDKTLVTWAESWNESLLGKRELDLGVDISGGAQFMRFISNVGASAEYNPQKGQVAIRGEAKTTLSVASGIAKATLYIPDRLGWDWSYLSGGQISKYINLGRIRLYIENQFIGFVGASAQLESQLQVLCIGDKQVVAGQQGGRLPRFKQREARGKQFYNQLAADEEGLTVSAEVFGGARAEYSLKGGVQWLKPTSPTSMHLGEKSKSPSAGEFVDFCSINSSISGLAGLGAGVNFQCDFIGGKFCFKIAASLCCGVGAKGAFLCEVAYGKFKEFAEWLVYQLFGMDYHFFELVTKNAFNTFTKMCVMQMMNMKNHVYAVYDDTMNDVLSVFEKFKKSTKEIIDITKTNVNSSKKRNQLAINIIDHSNELLNYSPEAKGILLYLLTRHGIWDHLDMDNRGKGLIPDIYADRKEAVILVLSSIQTQREWQQVLCHRSAEGTDIAVDESHDKVVAEQESQLHNFLQQGFTRAADMEKAKTLAIMELATIKNRVKSEISWGYALAMNNTLFYQLNTLPNPHYPARCSFAPCNSANTQLS